MTQQRFRRSSLGAPRLGQRRAPFGLGAPSGPRSPLGTPQPIAHPACPSLPERVCHHPLTDHEANRQLAYCEDSVKERFDRIVPFLKEVAALPRDGQLGDRIQELATDRLGHGFDEALVNDSWIEGPDLKGLFAQATFEALNAATRQFGRKLEDQKDDALSTSSFFLDCGFHAVDISPCSDGRLKGLMPFIFRLPPWSFTYRKAYAGALFDVEEDLRLWSEVELRRFREGVPNRADEGSRYLKIAVYHGSSSDPHHEGCAAHGSDERKAAEAALDRLYAFRQAVENTYCCGASTDILLVGVDTDTDAIRVHVPDANGDVSVHRYIDNAYLYQETLNLERDAAHLAIYNAIRSVNETDDWGRSTGGEPHDGMRRFIASLLINNLSQIDYVTERYQGRYPAEIIGHAERYISVGDGFEEVQMRNLAYFAHLQTVEENTNDLDVGIKIFRKLNVSHGLPIPIAIHFRYDGRVPGARDRAEARARRVCHAIRERHSELDERGMLYFQLTVQDRPSGSDIEEVSQA